MVDERKNRDEIRKKYGLEKKTTPESGQKKPQRGGEGFAASAKALAVQKRPKPMVTPSRSEEGKQGKLVVLNNHQEQMVLAQNNLSNLYLTLGKVTLPDEQLRTGRALIGALERLMKNPPSQNNNDKLFAINHIVKVALEDYKSKNPFHTYNNWEQLKVTARSSANDANKKNTKHNYEMNFEAGISRQTSATSSFGLSKKMGSGESQFAKMEDEILQVKPSKSHKPR